MDKRKESTNLQGVANGNEIIENLEPTVCSPEFPDGCMDVETGDLEQ